MNWVGKMFVSSIGRKVLMSLTGLFLCSFLVVHLSINLLMLWPDNGLLFNSASNFMGTNIVIRTLEIVLFGGLILHILQSLVITRINQKARPSKYEVSAGNATSKWYSRSMGILGSLILIFLVIHLSDFWFESRFEHNEMMLDSNGHPDQFTEAFQTFSKLWVVLIYLAGVISLGYHLLHGFQSAWRSIGIMHKKYTPFIKAFGIVFSLVMTLGFISIPLIIFLKQL